MDVYGIRCTPSLGRASKDPNWILTLNASPNPLNKLRHNWSPLGKSYLLPARGGIPTKLRGWRQVFRHRHQTDWWSVVNLAWTNYPSSKWTAGSFPDRRLCGNAHLWEGIASGVHVAKFVPKCARIDQWVSEFQWIAWHYDFSPAMHLASFSQRLA